MKLVDILKIDEGRISRSRRLEVELVKELALLRDPDNIFLRIIRRLFRMSKIAYRVLVFKVYNELSKSSYDVVVQLSPCKSYQKLLNTRVKIYCGCSDFMYRSAYILNQDKALFRNDKIDRKLSIAISTKPTKVPGGTVNSCKHISATFEYIRNNFDKLDLYYTK